MFGISIVENHYDDADNKFLIEDLSYPTIWFKSNLEEIADVWIEELQLKDDTKQLRECIVNRSFWYTHYRREQVQYIVRVFKVEENAEIYLK